MNYNIEDDFDFYKELNMSKTNKIENEKKEKICMISHDKLTYNSITLPCNHSFNYLPLYNELIESQKKNKTICCPYCRKVCNKLIPYIPLKSVQKIYGLNSPENQCLPSPKCCKIISCGIKKGSTCDSNGIEYAEGTFCKKHIPEIIKNVEWTEAMELMFKSKTMAELKILLSELGLIVGGVKKDLVIRLFTHKK